MKKYEIGATKYLKLCWDVYKMIRRDPNKIDEKLPYKA